MSIRSSHVLLSFFAKHVSLLLLLLLLSGAASAQIRVTGTVTSAQDGKPIAGASVVIQRTGRGTAADDQGDFNVQAASTDTLIFRAIGFKTKLLPLGGSGLSQIIIQVKLERANIQLGEVRVQPGRPDDATINRALRNIKRPTPPANAVRRPPKPKPLFPVDSTAPKAPVPTVQSPVSLIYDQFSKEGKQRRKLQELQAQDKAEQQRKERQQYNKSFKDNRGYE
ncbi:carboxypeptidase-like regulatory domain-containing protein [Hymenobacter sp. BT491]|uniref:carboxypeptidase-like regulatory domain-containing protein n=1 Tax=Hymenobacter sp. BT491 TaxID=2766779 RepID=UPI001653D036|nr:carboxypeptidase-like regulatory domain-containing protein [Hymenobacter sp. BT491]MBC6988130.1 carboxypeptidase-like regulatory domain-containing protein [Hymenobacter sp. BT491]